MEDLQNQINNMPEQDKDAMRYNPAGGLIGILAKMGGVNEMTRSLQHTTLGYRNIGDTISFKGIFEKIPSAKG